MNWSFVGYTYMLIDYIPHVETIETKLKEGSRSVNSARYGHYMY
jgi:hypothetical protein